MEELFRHQAGVVSTRVGYSGGDVLNATYGDHAESIEAAYDSEKIDFRALLELCFQVPAPDEEPREASTITVDGRVGANSRSWTFAV